jgi:uncharacterized protein YihD (DUF1040 family)
MKFKCIKDLVMNNNGEVAAIEGNIYEFKNIDNRMWEFQDEQEHPHYMEKEMDKFFVNIVKVEDLKEQLKELEDKARILRDKINEEEDRIAIPELKKKYEGKYFKYRNSYSCSENECDYWYVYYKVIKVVGHNNFRVARFQKTVHNEIEIYTDHFASEGVLEIKISKREYDRAFSKILKEIEGMK